LTSRAVFAHHTVSCVFPCLGGVKNDYRTDRLCRHRRNRVGDSVPLDAGRGWGPCVRRRRAPRRRSRLRRRLFTSRRAAISTATPAFHGDHGSDATTTEHGEQTGAPWHDLAVSASSRSARSPRHWRFFGLCGLAAQAARGVDHQYAAGGRCRRATAMAAVYWMMRGLQELAGRRNCPHPACPGPTRFGLPPHPRSNSGSGKIQLKPAKSDHGVTWPSRPAPKLPTGTRVVVVGNRQPDDASKSAAISSRVRETHHEPFNNWRRCVSRTLPTCRREKRP